MVLAIIINTFTGNDLCVSNRDCGSNAMCLNENGILVCKCNQGYNGNGTNCVGMKYFIPFYYFFI